MTSIHLNLLNCIDKIEPSIEKILAQQDVPLTHDEEELTLDFLKLNFCAEDWLKVVLVSSKILSLGKVQGLSQGLFYHYWLEALNALHDQEALVALMSHLTHLSPTPPSTSRLALCILAACYTNQKVSAEILISQLYQQNGAENHLDVLAKCHHYIGYPLDINDDQIRAFTEQQNDFLKLIGLLEVTGSEIVAEKLLEIAPYYVPAHLIFARKALKKQDYNHALKWLSGVREWNPNQPDALIGEAYCHAQLGDLMYAYHILKNYPTSERGFDLDYQSLMGDILVQLNERYPHREFREEGIQHIQNLITLKEKLQQDTLKWVLKLERLSGALTVSERRSPIKQAGRRVFLIQMSPKNWSFYQKANLVWIRAPRRVKKDDQILLSEVRPKGFCIKKLAQVEHGPVSDPKYPDRFYVKLKTIRHLPDMILDDFWVQQEGRIMKKVQVFPSMSFYEISQKTKNHILKKILSPNGELSDEAQSYAS